MLGIKVGIPRKPVRMGGALELETREEIRFELAKLNKLELPESEWQAPKGNVREMFTDIGLEAADLRGKKAFVGKGKVGRGVEAVEVCLAAGAKDSKIGEAFAIQMTHPRHGYEALTTILEPNLAVKPSTIIVPTAPQANLRQANMIYGPVQSAIGRAIAQNLENGNITSEQADKLVMITKVSVHPLAIERRDLHSNCLDAMDKAINKAFVK